ncbi:unnamed protein product [Pleuronectes platessa]|uniref:Uncharacterized protein n=1 Tax=Pleuronectes platessa TaxID=8262 RepID=A0A9N7Y4K4_PLEPL|nr:unnamed protein product [Pleuronectes platessa]
MTIQDKRRLKSQTLVLSPSGSGPVKMRFLRKLCHPPENHWHRDNCQINTSEVTRCLRRGPRKPGEAKQAVPVARGAKFTRSLFGFGDKYKSNTPPSCCLSCRKLSCSRLHHVARSRSF